MFGRAWLIRARLGAGESRQPSRRLLGGVVPLVRVVCAAIVAAILVAGAVHYVYFDRSNLPDLEAFNRFELPTIGRIYDVNSRTADEIASEYRQIVGYEDIPPVVRGAFWPRRTRTLLAQRSGLHRFVRVLSKLRIWNLLGAHEDGTADTVDSAAIFRRRIDHHPTARARLFSQDHDGRENSDQLRHSQGLARAFARVIGARTVNMLFRKLEEIRLSLWSKARCRRVRLETPRQGRDSGPVRQPDLHGKRQYGFAGGGILFWPAPRYVHRGRCGQGGAAGRRREVGPLLCAQCETRQRVYAAGTRYWGLWRRAASFPDQARAPASARLKPSRAQGRDDRGVRGVDTVLDELKGRRPVSANKTCCSDMCRYFRRWTPGTASRSQALEHGLLQYENGTQRQRSDPGFGVVLRNRDASILAETAAGSLTRTAPAHTATSTG